MMEKKYYLKIQDKGTRKLDKRHIWRNKDKNIYEIAELNREPTEITKLLESYGLIYPYNLTNCLDWIFSLKEQYIQDFLNKLSFIINELTVNMERADLS